VISHRAQEGARRVYQIITDKPETAEKPEKAAGSEKPIGPVKPAAADKRSPDHTGSIDDAVVAEAPAGEAALDTLSSDDLAAEWHLPPPPTL
jgi:hypothetical protein